METLHFTIHELLAFCKEQPDQPLHMNNNRAPSPCGCLLIQYGQQKLGLAIPFVATIESLVTPELTLAKGDWDTHLLISHLLWYSPQTLGDCIAPIERLIKAKTNK